MAPYIPVMLITVLAFALPLVPASLLLVSLRAKRALDALAPLQFAILVGGAVLAVNMSHTQGQAGAAVTVMVAIAGLFAAVLRKDTIARRALYSFDWEKFERDFHFYVLTADWLGT
jgi:hypothetical protein